MNCFYVGSVASSILSTTYIALPDSIAGVSDNFPLYPFGLYPWVWLPKPWNKALNKGIWDPKPRVANIKGTNLKSLSIVPIPT